MKRSAAILGPLCIGAIGITGMTGSALAHGAPLLIARAAEAKKPSPPAEVKKPSPPADAKTSPSDSAERGPGAAPGDKKPPENGPPEIRSGATLGKPRPGDEPIADLALKVLDRYLAFFPSRASASGLRQYAGELGDYRKPAVALYLAFCKESLVRLEGLPSAKFTQDGRLEQEALRVHLRAMIRLLESTQAPVRDPNFYVDETAGAIQVLMDRETMSRGARLQALVSRLSRVWEVLATAREGLRDCPRSAIQRAVERLRSMRTLFENVLPLELRVSMDPVGSKKNQEVAAAAWKEIGAFAAWLEKDRLPGARAAPALGEPGWREWLLSREDVKLSAGDVRAAAEADLAELRREMIGLARAETGADPGRSIAHAASALTAQRFEPSVAMTFAERITGAVWDWMLSERPVDPPSDLPIFVREAPGLRRRDAPIRGNYAGGFGAPDAASFLEIAAPDPGWPNPLMAEWLAAYGKWLLPGAVLRETFPGKFVASEARRLSPLRTCRTVSFPVFEEGWGLYAQEVGVRGGALGPETELRQALLLDLMRADARLIGSVRIHAQAQPVAEVGSWLAKEGLWAPSVATSEAERLLADPDLAAPALGRLMILALRDDVKKERGGAFSLREFHDKLLALGYAPLSAIRRAMVPARQNPLPSRPGPA